MIVRLMGEGQFEIDDEVAKGLNSLFVSVGIDLRISEIVDMPNFVVTAHCPLSIFE